MANQGKELYEFGPFQLDPGKRLLLRDNQPVPLQLKAFETLLVLVQHSEQVVLKEELMQAVWPDTFVEESNLAQNIFVLRKTLGAAVGDHRYIVTVPGRGYRFSEKVRVVAVEDALVLQRHSRTHVVIDERSMARSSPGAPAASPVIQSNSVQTASHTGVQTAVQTSVQTKIRTARLRLMLLVAVLAVTGTAFVFRPPVPPPRVTRIQQISHVGGAVHNTRILTDGPRLYFRAWDGKERAFRSMSSDGGEVSTLQKAFPEIDFNDLSPVGSEFLAVNLGDKGSSRDSDEQAASLWRVPLLGGSPRPVGEIRAHEAIWSPDGRSIAYAVGSGIYRTNLEGSDAKKLVTLPNLPIYMSWAPDAKRIRFSCGDPKSTGYDLWELNLDTDATAPIIRGTLASARPWSGGWTSDGRYFFYTAVNDGIRNIWAVREKDDLLHRADHQPVQLTNGPFTFYLALPSRDGKHIFAVGEQLRGQLIRHDALSQQFLPYAQGISADHVAFSPDGQWMAYVEYPEGTLVRSRPDGSERLQLTFPPLRAHNPQWSHDGKQIAFHGSSGMSLFKIYLVPSTGGLPSVAVPQSDDRQTYPSWSSDGNSILFGSADASMLNPELHTLNLKTRQVTALSGTSGLALAQISPDGRSIAAISRQTGQLVLYDTASHTTRSLAELGDYPRWSADGRFVYFSTLYFSPRGRNGGIFRWNASTNSIEALVKYPQFLLAGLIGINYSIAPDGSIILLRDTSNRDIYALDVDLP